MRYKGFVLAVVIVAILAVGYARIGTKIKLPGPPTIPHQSLTDPPLELPEAAVFPIDILDASGRSVHLNSAPNRIVSLAPAATEMLFDIGVGDKIVGDTTACDWPAAAKSIPHIGGYSDMSLESIAARSPDLIVADLAINRDIVMKLQEANMPILVMDAKDLDTSYAAIRMLGRATGRTDTAATVINTMRGKFASIAKTVANATSVRRVLVMYDASKIYTSGPGTLVDDAIHVAGGKNIATANQIDPEVVLDLQPDVIICEPDLEAQIASLPGWKGAVPAVTSTAYFHVSKDATLVRGTLRLADGVAELARFLHPELYTSKGAPVQTAQPPPSGRGK